MSSELQQVLKVWERTRANSPIYAFLLSDIDVYEAEKGVFHARLQVAPHHLNSKAIASHGLDVTGVSTDIHVNYLSTATTGDWLEIEGRAEKVGRTLAFTTITISKKTESSPVVVAKGSHTKYIKTKS